jgi:hypothetical protein
MSYNPYIYFMMKAATATGESSRSNNEDAKSLCSEKEIGEMGVRDQESTMSYNPYISHSKMKTNDQIPEHN